MARIRSVKPEFWTDDDVLGFSDSCALFYISLWNFCDDEGKIKNSPKQISKQVARWSQDKVQVFIRCLLASGQLRLSLCSGWLQVVQWHHQRINRPVQPKVKASDLQWITGYDSLRTHDQLTEDSPQGEDRKGEDRKGREGNAPSLTLVAGVGSTPKPDKNQIFEEIFSDERFIESLSKNFPGIDLRRAWEGCWLHHSVTPNPPEHSWQWRQKLSTWLEIEIRKTEIRNYGTKQSNGTNQPSGSANKNSAPASFGAL